MPLFIKAILMLWVLTIVGIIFLRAWFGSASEEQLYDYFQGKRPMWFLPVGIMIWLSVIAIIPFFAWLIFIH